MHGGTDKRIHVSSKPSREAAICLGLDVQILNLCYCPLHLDARVCSLPFVLSETEGLNLRVIYVGGPCNAHNRILLADSPARHLVLGVFLCLLVPFHYWITADRIF